MTKQRMVAADALRGHPVGTQVRDCLGVTWTKTGPDLWAAPGERDLRSGSLSYGSPVVVEVVPDAG